MSAPDRRAMVERPGEDLVGAPPMLVGVSHSGVFRPKPVTGADDVAVRRTPIRERSRASSRNRGAVSPEISTQPLRRRARGVALADRPGTKKQRLDLPESLAQLILGRHPIGANIALEVVILTSPTR